jgi:hypothetical protein
MQDRLDRLHRVRRQTPADRQRGDDRARHKKLTAPDFTVSIRPGMLALLVIDEKAVPSIYWQPVAPKLKRQELLSELKMGSEITGVTLLQSGTGVEREDTVDGLLRPTT